MDVVIGKRTYVILKVQPIFDYQDGKKTETIIGYSYTCVDMSDYDRYLIKIKGQTIPLMTNEELQQHRTNGDKILVEFKNLAVYLFYNEKEKVYQDSFSADAISFVTNK